MTTLIDLAEKHQPDKLLHNYMPAYELLLAPMRHKVKRVLEIGVLDGTSLRMWADYFPEAEIVGLDIDEDCQKHAGGRISVVIGDQGKRKVRKALGEFDLIIDDGSHKAAHQIGTFLQMFPAQLNNGGIYVIEDLETPQRRATRNMLMDLIELLHYWPDGMQGRDWKKLNHFPDDAPALSKMILSLHVLSLLHI